MGPISTHVKVYVYIDMHLTINTERQMAKKL